MAEVSERELDGLIAAEWRIVRRKLHRREYDGARVHQRVACELMRQRTPEHVARLERERGLA